MAGQFSNEVREIFEQLWQDLVFLHVKVEILLELYAKDQERVDLLNRMAPEFFHITQKVYWDSCCRSHVSWIGATGT